VKKQIKLDSLPEILIVQLARFSFDYYKGIPIKVNLRTHIALASHVRHTFLNGITLHCSVISLQIMKSVEYPATLTFAPHHLSDELRQRLGSAPASYQLQAAVLHHGKKATGGHYSAFTLETQRRAAKGDSNGQGGGSTGVSGEKGASGALRDARVWHSVNDAKVSTISESQALGAQDSAYILFYGRVHS
jgi:ubiquitin C-terminal hydrolase